jgi:RHS repeat-associated protein
MSIYTLIPEEVVPDPEDFDLRLTERDIYGSSRLGTENINQVIASTIGEHININTDLTQVVGDKHYELSNLPTTFGIGNVLQLVTDRKLAQDNGEYDLGTYTYTSVTPDGIIDYFTSDVVSQSDYYPFGMMLPDRNSSGDEYRYGFNGMEKDDEVSGNANSYDFGARIYNPRVGRWLSVDPKGGTFPGLSPYNYCYNDPTIIKDPNGETGIVTIRGDKVIVSQNNYYYRAGIDQEIATAMAQKVQDDWNAAHGTVTIDGKTYPVEFEITGTAISGPEEAVELIKNACFEDNFIAVGSTGRTSVTNGSTAYYNPDQNERQGGTTYSHEPVHGWGLHGHTEAQTSVVVNGEIVGEVKKENIDENGNIAMRVAGDGSVIDGVPIDASKRIVMQNDIDALKIEEALNGGTSGKLGEWEPLVYVRNTDASGYDSVDNPHPSNYVELANVKIQPGPISTQGYGPRDEKGNY